MWRRGLLRKLIKFKNQNELKEEKTANLDNMSRLESDNIMQECNYSLTYCLALIKYELPYEIRHFKSQLISNFYELHKIMRNTE